MQSFAAGVSTVFRWQCHAENILLIHKYCVSRVIWCQVTLNIKGIILLT